MPKSLVTAWLLAALCLAPAIAQVYPDALPSNRSAAGAYSMRNLSLGEPAFSDTRLYNLYDQGGSPMGLLESHAERMSLELGFLGAGSAVAGDSVEMSHRDYYIPQLGFFQPGVFGAILYFHRESEAYRRRPGDTVETGKTRFGLDLAAGPSSGLFRVGFGAHGALGTMDYPGETERVIMDVPSLRLDVGSRLHPSVELDVFVGMSLHFDSLNSSIDRLERVAYLTLPRYGILADVGGMEGIPLMGNTLFELGTDRFLGEYRQVNQAGLEYPTIWTGYWDFQTQWIYAAQVGDFRLAPALRFARRSEDAQGYKGIRSNQNPLKKGDKLDSLHWEHGITAFGLGGNFAFRENVTLLLEWETAGHSYERDTTIEKRYNRFSAGLENRVDQWAAGRFPFPKGMSLALRMGWTWRQEEKGRPGYRAFQFDPFVSSAQVPTRSASNNPIPDDPAGYGAFQLGLGLGLFDGRATLDGLLNFPGQLERMSATRSKEASGLELGLMAGYRVY